MTELISIRESAKHVDEEVRMHVWLTDKRSSGKIVFLQLRDGTAFFQGVVRKNDVSEEVFEAAKGLRQEASFYLTGTIHEDARSHFGYEIQISDLEVVSNNEGYPITNKEHGIDFLFGPPSPMAEKPAAIRHHADQKPDLQGYGRLL